MYLAWHYIAISVVVSAALAGCGEEKPLGNQPLIPGGEESSPADDPDQPSANKEELGGKPTGNNKPTANVVAGCYDGDFAETLPDLSVSIDDLVASYDSLGGETFVMQAMGRRYPVGKKIVEGAKDNDFCKSFLTGTGQGAVEDLNGLSMTIHECGHMFDLLKIKKDFDQSAFYVTDQLTLTCQGAGGKTTTSAENTVIGRGAILTDAYQSQMAPCDDGEIGGECDSYAPKYLAGDDGNYGFDLLMEESNQYVHSLASAYAFSDQFSKNTYSSDRDGILNFLWYIQRYLKLTREEHPDDYAFIVGNECWRKMILTTWGRAWLYLDTTKDLKNLQINGGKLLSLVQDPVLLDEIQLVRKAESCTK